MELNFLQKRAVEIIKEGGNLFLTGNAGTGKSTVINAIKDNNTILCAPTGVAALLIGGTTAHSLFGLPIGLPTAEDWNKVPKTLKKIFSGKNPPRIVLDEIGMLNAQQLDMIDRRLKLVRDNDLPFGGVQVIAVGDFLQLEPIIGNREKKHYYAEYDTPYCFGAKSWNFKVVKLTQVMRQDGKRQPALLDSIRMKDEKHEAALRIIQSEAKPYNFQDEVLTLSAYNADADLINKFRYDKLEGEEYTYYATSTGKELKPNEMLVDPVLKLKVGAKVLIKANDLEFRNYVNGDRGVVVACYPDTVVVNLDNGGIVEVTPFKWEKIKYSKGVKGLTKTPESTYKQIPIRLGYAVSGHSIQGCTLDEAAIDVGKGCFSAGQLYVMLSRVRDLRNLSFVRKVSGKDVIVHEDAVDFYKNLENPSEEVSE